MTTWAKAHPKFVSHLMNFAQSSIQRADLVAEKIDVGNALDDASRDPAVRKPTYQLADKVLRLAEILGPHSQETKRLSEETQRLSQKTQRLLSKTEELLGDHSSAYGRLSRLIGSFELEQKNDMLFFSHEFAVGSAQLGPSKT